METKGLHMNNGKTKVMVSRKNSCHVEYLWMWPRSKCGKDVVNNSIHCT